MTIARGASRYSTQPVLETNRALSYLAATMKEELCAYCDNPATTRARAIQKAVYSPTPRQSHYCASMRAVQ
jgi:hypothetical protein